MLAKGGQTSAPSATIVSTKSNQPTFFSLDQQRSPKDYDNFTPYSPTLSASKLSLLYCRANALIHAWLGRTLAAEKKFDEAVTEANAALKIEPPVGSALAWAHVTLGQAAMARH